MNSCRAGVALVIGAGEYLRAERVEPLRFAARDARALAHALADPDLCAFPADQVILLTDGDARRDEIVQRLSRWLPEKARGTELVVIYFAGHGMVQTVGRREEGFLLPYDADPDDVVTRGVAMSDVARWIDGLDTRAVVVCLDCCHAGKVLGQRDPEPASAARNMELRPAVLERMTGRGRYLIASCDEGQKSFECAELGHGLFTYHLLQGIAGAADRDGDGRVGLAELFNYVSTAVSRDSRQRFGREQKPWTSATWAEETYISSPNSRVTVTEADPLEQVWREQGVIAAVQEIERMLPQADEECLKRSLRFLGRVKESAGIPTIFRCLSHASETVRREARSALHTVGWDIVVGAVEGLARRDDQAAMAAILDGLNAFEAHPQVVSLLDRLVVLLKGELRTRAILLLERKRLGLELDQVAALFREIHSPYQIQKVLGQGLFTESYLARDEATCLEVVVRVLRPEFASQPHVRARFLDLSNQSVPLVHEKLALTREARAFPDRNIYFAVRDYVAGVTLQRVLEGGKQFEPIQVVRILRDVAEALTPLHRKAMCHGGIKPSNIFICEGDRVILGDPSLPVQGIGIALDRLAYDYRYAAPENFLGGATVGPAADFYALGCVAYELVCGMPPFVSDNYHELVAHHINGSIIPPSQRGGRLVPKGEEIVLKLLGRSRGERYATLEEVLRAFASWEFELRLALREWSDTASPSHRLLRDASLMNCQVAESFLHFDQTQTGAGAGTPAPPAEQTESPKVPGYEVLGEIGRGGMGMVYKARDVHLNRLVALKVLRAGAGASSEALTRFRREAGVIAHLHHPNIVQIYGLITHEGLVCLALEYVEGGDLAQTIRQWEMRGGQMPIRQAAELMATLARAVEFAHQRHVLHRDLKPSNILLTSDGQPKIADFGLSKIQADLGEGLAESLVGIVMGTPAYMAPEQWKGLTTSPATDVYALGMIFYEMLAGRRPFPRKSYHEMMYDAIDQNPAPLTRVQPEIPSELEAICLRCLEKDPARRYPTAARLADDLDRWSRGETVTVQRKHLARESPGENLDQGLQEEPVTAGPLSIWQRLARLFSFRKSGASRRADQTPDA
jgi:serine/threonine-protein kinase